MMNVEIEHAEHLAVVRLHVAVVEEQLLAADFQHSQQLRTVTASKIANMELNF